MGGADLLFGKGTGERFRVVVEREEEERIGRGGFEQDLRIGPEDFDRGIGREERDGSAQTGPRIDLIRGFRIGKRNGFCPFGPEGEDHRKRIGSGELFPDHDQIVFEMAVDPGTHVRAVLINAERFDKRLGQMQTLFPREHAACVCDPMLEKAERDHFESGRIVAESGAPESGIDSAFAIRCGAASAGIVDQHGQIPVSESRRAVTVFSFRIAGACQNHRKPSFF